MEKSIQIPKGVEVKYEEKTLIVKGPKGELSREFRNPYVTMQLKDNEIFISSKNDRRKVKAIVGTWRAHAANMIQGVQTGWESKLKIVYSHFPIKFKVEGDRAVISNFLGERKDRVCRINSDVKVELKKDEVVVTGINREIVGQTAANIENTARVVGFDRRIFQDGLHLIQKTTPLQME